MKRTLVLAGVILFGLCFFGLWIAQGVKLSATRAELSKTAHQRDSAFCKVPDTIFKEYPVVRVEKRYYPAKYQIQSQVSDSLSKPGTPDQCEIRDSLAGENLKLQYSIHTTDGRFDWITFDYKVKCPEFVKMPAPEPRYIEVQGKCPDRTKYSAMGFIAHNVTVLGAEVESSRWAFSCGYDFQNKAPAMGIRYVIRK